MPVACVEGKGRCQGFRAIPRQGPLNASSISAGRAGGAADASYAPLCECTRDDVEREEGSAGLVYAGVLVRSGRPANRPRAVRKTSACSLRVLKERALLGPCRFINPFGPYCGVSRGAGERLLCADAVDRVLLIFSLYIGDEVELSLCVFRAYLTRYLVETSD